VNQNFAGTKGGSANEKGIGIAFGCNDGFWACRRGYGSGMETH
jgi:hypothetical protein